MILSHVGVDGPQGKRRHTRLVRPGSVGLVRQKQGMTNPSRFDDATDNALFELLRGALADACDEHLSEGLDPEVLSADLAARTAAIRATKPLRWDEDECFDCNCCTRAQCVEQTCSGRCPCRVS